MKKEVSRPYKVQLLLTSYRRARPASGNVFQFPNKTSCYMNGGVNKQNLWYCPKDINQHWFSGSEGQGPRNEECRVACGIRVISPFLDIL